MDLFSPSSMRSIALALQHAGRTDCRRRRQENADERGPVEGKSTIRTLFRARVPTARLRKAEKVFARLGMKPDAHSIFFLAQVELRDDLPFAITTHPELLLSTAEQGKVWEKALGEY
jgi:antitoxin component of RelBE/YafQ-DinJ toxin-antitoxin module